MNRPCLRRHMLCRARHSAARQEPAAHRQKKQRRLGRQTDVDCTALGGGEAGFVSEGLVPIRASLPGQGTELHSLHLPSVALPALALPQPALQQPALAQQQLLLAQDLEWFWPAPASAPTAPSLMSSPGPPALPTPFAWSSGVPFRLSFDAGSHAGDTDSVGADARPLADPLQLDRLPFDPAPAAMMPGVSLRLTTRIARHLPGCLHKHLSPAWPAAAKLMS